MSTADTPYRIFIVEDEFITAADLEAEITRLGYQVVGTAASGEEALEKIAQTAPELVLMDIMLKGDMDGIEAARIVRERYEIPVIFLTANSNDAILDRAKTSEPFGYLLKPFEQRYLKTNIEMALYKGRMERERADLTRQLQKALAQVETLSGLLPICAWCKKIRDERGTWEPVETYVSRRTKADFSHGVCPDCARTFFPGLSD